MLIATDKDLGQDNLVFITIAFLLPFAGSILASFLYATLAGEERLSLRSHAMAMVAGAGYTVTVGYIFFGLIWLLEIEGITGVYVTIAARVIFIAVIIVAPSFVILSLLDPIMLREIAISEGFPEQIKEHRFLMMKLLGIEYLPLMFFILIAPFVTPYLHSLNTFELIFLILVIFSLLLIVLGGFYSLYLTNKNYDYHITPLIGIVWILLNSMINGILVLMLPVSKLGEYYFGIAIAAIFAAFIFAILWTLNKINHQKIESELKFWASYRTEKEK